jgi:hypothetical protein
MNQELHIDVSEAVGAIHEAGLANSLVTILRFDGTSGTTGRPSKDDPANWDEVADHDGLEAMVAADIYMTNVTRSKEIRLGDTIAKLDSSHILLMGFYPLIQQEDRAVVTTPGRADRTFDITGAEGDSQSAMTRLEVRQYR